MELVWEEMRRARDEKDDFHCGKSGVTFTVGQDCFYEH